MDKIRTHPASVCQHDDGWNVRGLDGHLVLQWPVPQKAIAERIRDAINQHFDWGRDGPKIIR